MTAPRERAGPKRWKLVLWRRGTGVASSPSVSNNCGEVIIARDFQNAICCLISTLNYIYVYMYLSSDGGSVDRGVGLVEVGHSLSGRLRG